MDSIESTSLDHKASHRKKQYVVNRAEKPEIQLIIIALFHTLHNRFDDKGLHFVRHFRVDG
jgi:hypothetical protein